jgi:ATP-dependent DNA ligase
MRLNFAQQLMPTLVEPPEGDAWIHEVKFDGYRSQIVIDEEARIVAARRTCGTPRYRISARRHDAVSLRR